MQQLRRAVERGGGLAIKGPTATEGPRDPSKKIFYRHFLGWKQKLIIQIVIFSRQRIFIHGWGSLQGAPWASFPGPQSGSQRACSCVLTQVTVNNWRTDGANESIDWTDIKADGPCRSLRSWLPGQFTIYIKKVKFSHTRYQALGPELIPVYRWREVNRAIYLVVVCHCFLPGLRLPS